MFGAVKYESGFRISIEAWLFGALGGASGGWQRYDPFSKRWLWKSRPLGQRQPQPEPVSPRIAQELLSTGKYPSRRTVRPLLAESKLKGIHLIVREVQKVVDDFTARTVPVASQKPSS